MKLSVMAISTFCASLPFLLNISSKKFTLSIIEICQDFLNDASRRQNGCQNFFVKLIIKLNFQYNVMAKLARHLALIPEIAGSNLA